MSKLEDKIEKILQANRISYIKEYSFSNLLGKNNQPLRFDFAIFSYNKLQFLIEVEGRQHYEFVKRFHKTYSGFLQYKERDRVKNSYCLKNKIPLLRIPYWDINDNLTLQKILTNQDYRVNSKFFTDNLIVKRNKR